MLYFTRWKALAIVLTALFICLFAVPNFLPEKMVASWPKWAQRHVVLGLDLQGGSHLLLEVDTKAVRKEMLETLRDDMRRVLREARIGYTGLVVRGSSAEVRIREGANADQALEKLRTLSQPLGGILSATGQRSLYQRGRWPDPAYAERARDRRAGAPVGRSVDPDHRAARQRTRHGGAADPARRHRPHSGPGSRPAGSDPAQAIARQDRQARFPHGRYRQFGGAGDTRPGAAG
jgi:preprotein translocase subunit SecD